MRDPSALTIQIRMSTDAAPEWQLEVSIARDQLDGVIRKAAGIDGGLEWHLVELFVRDAVRTALLNWAEKTFPEVQRIRSERDLTYAALGRKDAFTSPHEAFERLEAFARKELKPREVEAEEAFARFLWKHYGGLWARTHNAEHDRQRLALPPRVEASVAELARTKL